MKTLSAHIAGLSRRAKVLLTIVCVILILGVVSAGALALNPRLATDVTHVLLIRSMAGTAQSSDGYGPIKYGGRCLTVTTEWLWAPGKFQVRLWECDPSNPGTQQWRFLTDQENFIVAHSPLGDEVCLDVEGASKSSGATVATFQCIRSANNEHWHILGLGFLDQVEGDGIKIQNENSGMCVDPADPSAHSYMVQRPCDQAVWYTWPPHFLPKPR
jgi:hypothetical protein